MNNFRKATLALLLVTGAALANENFGGIGISFQKEGDAAKIVDIIPGTPAAESKLQVNDKIIAVDGISLKEKSVNEITDMLRGMQNKPVEVKFVSAGDTSSIVMQRVQITVKTLEEEQLQQWYNKKELDSHEIETYASSTENDKKLLAVLKKGSVLHSGDKASTSNLDGIYVENEKISNSKSSSKKVASSNNFNFKSMTRQTVAFETKMAGNVTVSIATAEGEQIATLSMKNAKAGFNKISWNGEKAPSGNYIVTLGINSSNSGFAVTLK